MNIVVAGHLCLDIIPDWKVGSFASIKPGSMIQTEALAFTTGGAVTNTGVALKRLGFNPVLMGRTGDDHVGTIIRSIIQEEGISTEHVACIPGAKTSYTVVLSPPDTDRAFLHFPGTNDSFGVDDVDLEGVEPGLFHLGYPPLMRQMYIDRGKNLQAVFRKVKEEGWITSLDMALPDPNSLAGRADWEVILANVLPFVDFFLPSLDELLYMIDREMFHAVQSGLQISTTLLDDLSQRLLDLGATVVAIKLGDQGLYLRTGAVAGSTLGEVWGHRQLLSPIFEVDVQGTTGAGDTTIAGFLAGLHQSNKPEDVVTLANGVGAFCVEAVSAIDGIPSLKEVQARISRGWKRVQPTMDHHQWQAGQHGVLFGPNDRRK